MLLYEVADQVNSTLELEECLDRIIDGAYRIFRAEKVSLMLVSEDSDEMRICAARNVPDEVIANTRILPGQGLAGKVALSGEPLVVADMEDDPRLQQKSKRQYRTGSFAIVPLKHKDRVLGVINLTNRSDGTSFSEEDLALLQALANQATIAIENSRLIGQLSRDKEQLHRRAFESDILYQVSSSIRYGLGYQHLIELLASSLDQLLDYDVLCSLLVVNGDEDFEVHTRRDVQPESVAGVERLLLRELELRPHGATVRQRIDALRAELGPDAAPASPGSAISVPLEVSGQAMGVVGVASRRANAFTAEDCELLQSIVQKMAQTVERLQNIIRGEQDKMQSMVASMAEGAVMFDAHGDLTVLNPKARSMLGLSPTEEFTAQTFFKSVVWKEIGSFLAQPVEEDGAVQEFTIDAQPEPRTLLAAVTPVTNNRGETLGRLAVIRDVTLERELDRMKSDFVAVVSHELRTPLASIKMFISNLLDGVEGEITEGQHDTLSRVTKNVDRLSRLINDLLDLSKLEAGKMKIQPAAIGLREAVESIVHVFTPAAAEKGVRLQVNAPERLPVLWADPDRFDQVLTNLAGNALKFTPENGQITIDVSRCAAGPAHEFATGGRASPISSEGHLRISVTDTGEGIPGGDVEHVFDKFYQADHSMTRKTGGTGLGLPICKEIIAKHGGRIWAESEPGKGAAFTFEIPIDSRKHDRAQLHALTEREIRRAKRYGTPFAALILDIDDFTVLNETHGYQNGDAALLQLQDILRDEVKKFLEKRIRETDAVGRFGGDEFLVIAPETDAAGGGGFAERLRGLIEAHAFTVNGQEIRATVSIGVTAFEDDDAAPVSLIRRAVAALAEAKTNGKNRVRRHGQIPDGKE
ncbi:MAG: GAF domain-containing protein [Planctomycetota bacterium]